MSGTGQLPSIDAEPERWAADPHRWARLKATLLVLALTLVGGGAGWWWTGEPAGGLVAAACLVILVAAVVVVPTAWARLDAQDARHTRQERDLSRLAPEVGVMRTRQDADTARLSVLGQRVEEQHLEHLECRSERRNQVLDFNRRKPT